MAIIPKSLQRGTGLRTVFALYLFLTLLLPLLTLVVVAFTDEPANPVNLLLQGRAGEFCSLLQRFSWEPVREVFATTRYQQALTASLILSAAVAAGATLVGTLVAFAASLSGVPGRHLFASLLPIPLAIPPFLGAIGLKLLAGRSGMLNHLLSPLGLPWPSELIYSYGGVALVQVASLFPFVALNVRAALSELDPSLEEAGRTLGGAPAWTFATITLPLLAPALGAGFLLTFMLAFGDFGTPLILLPPSQKLLILEAYKDLTGGLFWAEAAIQSLIIIFFVGAVLLLERRLLAGREYYSLSVRRATVLPSEISWFRRGLGFTAAVVFALPLLLIASMFLLALAASWGARPFPDALTTANLLRVTVAAPGPLLVTAVAAVLTIGCSLLLGTLAAHFFKRLPGRGNTLLEFGLSFPLVLPGIALGIGLIAAYNAPPLALHPSAFLLILSYVLTRTPYALVAVRAALEQIPGTLEEASAALGGRPIFTWRHVLAPVLLPALASAALFIYFSVTHDISLTLLLSPPHFVPVSISLYHELDSGRNFLAAAYGTLLFIATAVPYLIYSAKQR